MLESYEGILRNLWKLYRRKPKSRPFFIAALVCVVLACVFGILEATKVLEPKIADNVAVVFGMSAGLIGLILSAYQSVIEQKGRQERLKVKEEEVQKNPEKTRAAWDLAQEKLENYLDRNLAQVRSIYWLCVIVMLFGFVLIASGAILIYKNPQALNASVLSSISGILVTFLGGTLLFIYKSTMSQAKDYVSMLERINAVGMSLQIIDTLDGANKDMQNQAKADLAKELLKIYSVK